MKKTNMFAGMLTCVFAVAGIVNDSNAQSWGLNGNAGTTSTNFLGTTDAKALTIKTNNAKRITITSSGNTGIGNTAPKFKLDVNGGTAGSDTIAAANFVVKKTGNFDVAAVRGTSQPAAGYGIGLQGIGNFAGCFANGGNFGVIGVSLGVGVDGEASEVGNTEFLTGAQGLCSGGNVSVGVYGSCTGALTNYGVYGEQQDTLNSPDYALVGIGDVYGWRFFQASDRKLKKNISVYEGALDKINQLVASTYTFDHAKYPGMALPGGTQIGFMADNVQEVFPGLIKTASLPTGSTRDARGKVTYHSIPDVKTVNYIGLIPVLAEAIKEQKAIVEQKDVVISQQNDRIAKLENQMNQLASLMQQSGQITEQQKKAIVSTDNAKLFQNQPNPANGNTVISFYIPTSAKSASIKVVDAQGVVLKNITISQRGNSQVTINASEFATGNYNYSLVVDGKIVDSKAMLMTK